MTSSEESRTYEWLVEWLGEVANSSAKGEVTNECELPGGRWLVSEEWPSRRAYLEFARNRYTTQAMIYEDRKAREEDAQRRRR